MFFDPNKVKIEYFWFTASESWYTNTRVYYINMVIITNNEWLHNYSFSNMMSFVCKFV